jgi:transcriptional regulator with XRE-family HTH domain
MLPATIPRPNAATVRYFRARLGLSQIDLAERAEVAPGSIVNIEDADGRVPRPLTLRRVARALGVEVTKLFEAPPGDGAPAVDLAIVGVAVPNDAIAEAQQEAADAALGLSELDLDELAATVGHREAEYRAVRDAGKGGTELNAVRRRYVRALAALVQQRAAGDNVELVLRQALGKALLVAEGPGEMSQAG